MHDIDKLVLKYDVLRNEVLYILLKKSVHFYLKQRVDILKIFLS